MAYDALTASDGWKPTDSEINAAVNVIYTWGDMLSINDIAIRILVAAHEVMLMTGTK